MPKKINLVGNLELDILQTENEFVRMKSQKITTLQDNTNEDMEFKEEKISQK